jgi:hypothetical protein
MTRHGLIGRYAKALWFWPQEPHVVNTANCDNDTGWAASQGLGEDACGRNARLAPSSKGCRTARNPSKAQAEIIKSP